MIWGYKLVKHSKFKCCENYCFHTKIQNHYVWMKAPRRPEASSLTWRAAKIKILIKLEKVWQISEICRNLIRKILYYNKAGMMRRKWKSDLIKEKCFSVTPETDKKTFRLLPAFCTVLLIARRSVFGKVGHKRNSS